MKRIEQYNYLIGLGMTDAYIMRSDVIWRTKDVMTIFKTSRRTARRIMSYVANAAPGIFSEYSDSQGCVIRFKTESLVGVDPAHLARIANECINIQRACDNVAWIPARRLSGAIDWIEGMSNE